MGESSMILDLVSDSLREIKAGRCRITTVEKAYAMIKQIRNEGTSLVGLKVVCLHNLRPRRYRPYLESYAPQ
jgi:hypothetical protein